MKKRLALTIAIVLIFVVLLSAFTAISIDRANSKKLTKPFYVGVTYCGSSVQEAQQLIDKVKNYTNLFVLQSGQLMANLNATEQICDYAVNAGLNIIVCYTTNSLGDPFYSFLNISQARWGNHLLGIYYNDEPGGKMLDSQTLLYDSSLNNTVYKNQDRSIVFGRMNDTTVFTYTLLPSGEINLETSPRYMTRSFGGSDLIIYDPNGTIIPSTPQQATTTDYFPNGTISYTTNRTLTYQPDGKVQDENGALVNDQGNISQFESYTDVLKSCPIQTGADASNYYVNTQKATLSDVRKQSSLKLFTSDYALYWWDYKGGYDSVFAELGWNNTAAQEIGLVRGAANMQGKSWGTIITWTYMQPPYLINGAEMFNQMRLSYECGAQYVIVFNYAEKGTGQYGTLNDEHFQALERFWNDVVQNSSEVHGGIKAEAALVLPEDYGSGMRNPQDNIWGLWDANTSSTQVWNQIQSKLALYGSRLDLVYDDSAYSLAGKYSQIFYWNQTT